MDSESHEHQAIASLLPEGTSVVVTLIEKECDVTIKIEGKCSKDKIDSVMLQLGNRKRVFEECNCKSVMSPSGRGRECFENEIF